MPSITIIWHVISVGSYVVVVATQSYEGGRRTVSGSISCLHRALGALGRSVLRSCGHQDHKLEFGILHDHGTENGFQAQAFRG